MENQPGSLQRTMERSRLQEGSRQSGGTLVGAGGQWGAQLQARPGQPTEMLVPWKPTALVAPEERGGGWERWEAISSLACLSLRLVVINGNMEGLLWWLRRLRICLQCRRPGFDPWIGKVPWRREWLPTPVFLPGEFYGQRHLAGYSPWHHKELDTTERWTYTVEIWNLGRGWWWAEMCWTGGQWGLWMDLVSTCCSELLLSMSVSQRPAWSHWGGNRPLACLFPHRAYASSWIRGCWAHGWITRAQAQSHGTRE